jgi:4-hydroxybenzoate polyprenyltransferase
MYWTAPERGQFFRDNGGALRLLALACGGLALFLAFLLGWVPFILVLAGGGAGVLYAVGPGWTGWRALPVRWLVRLPGGKELFVGLAWAVTTALVPGVATGALADRWPAVGGAMAFAFLMGTYRTLLTDLTDVEGDQLVGRETLAGLLGEQACERLIVVLLACLAGLSLAGGPVLDWTNWLSFAMLVPVAYSGVCFALFRRGKLPEGELGEALLDGIFYACGLVAAGGLVL